MGHAVNTQDAVNQSAGKAKVVGNPDNWQLMIKFDNGNEDNRLIVSTKGMQTSTGVLVAVYRNELGNVSEALTFIPGGQLVDDVNGGKKLA